MVILVVHESSAISVVIEKSLTYGARPRALLIELGFRWILHLTRSSPSLQLQPRVIIYRSIPESGLVGSGFPLLCRWHPRPNIMEWYGHRDADSSWFATNPSRVATLSTSTHMIYPLITYR